MSWPFEVDTAENYAYWDGAFTREECVIIREVAKRHSLAPAIVYNKDNIEVDNSIRISDVVFLNHENCPELDWVYGRMSRISIELNEKYFKFDLWGYAEGFQFTEYKSPGGKYDAHMDKTYMKPIRKLSTVLQLTDENEYEGGDLNVYLDGNPDNAIKLSRKQGTILAFPSYIMHSVSPVTSGTRYSFVGWITGKQFR